ncbi:MAG: strawberry notch C-terminal domain-containing protein [Microcoleaceae cyanobacterium]
MSEPHNLDNTLRSHLIKHFSDGEGFRSITSARKWASDLTGDRYNPGTPNAKALEESIEESLVAVSRQIVRESDSPLDTFDQLVDLYQRQPILGTRSSGSVERQAYSTPTPIAFLASRLAGIDEEKTVYEPTAGNGALLIETDPEKVILNEIDPKRVAQLKQSGFHPNMGDATEFQPEGKFDVVIANPPFGRVKDDDNNTLSWDVGLYRSKEIDHAIALKSLESLKDDGTAVLIIAGTKDRDPEERSNHYNSGQSLPFFKTLYDHYNVTQHFSIDGDLYNRQGAGFPIDVIKIEGRGKSAKSLPAVDLPPMYHSFEELREVLTDAVLDGYGQSNLRREIRDDSLVLDSGGVAPGDSLSTASKRSPEMSRPSSGEALGTGGATRGTQQSLHRVGIMELEGTTTQLGSSPSDTPQQISEFVTAETMGISDDHRSPDDKRASTAGIMSNDLSSVSSNRRTGGGSFGTHSNNGTVRVVEPSEHSTHRTIENNELSNDNLQTLSTHRTIGNNGLSHDSLQASSTRNATGNDKLGNHDLQAPYEPFSKGKRLGGLVPINMQGTVHKVLGNLVDRVTTEEGIEDIDDWVLKKLNHKAPNSKFDSGHWTKERLFDALSAEQIDSVALGIYNFDRDSEFIIGDETGFGKTRQLAALTVYGMQQGFTPVYVTKDEDLYKDVLDGFNEIGVEGVNAFATNTPRKGGSSHKLELQKIHSTGDLGDKNMVLTTYSQIQTVRGKETPRRQLLREIVSDDGLLIMDECHLAGGGKTTVRDLGQDKPPNGAMFARELKEKADRVISASATFAKYPEVMDLYSRTDMIKAVENPERLPDLINQGGRGLQEILSNQLTEAGQYFRRERPFQAEFKTVNLAVDKQLCDAESKVMDAIVQFDQIKQGVVKGISDNLKEEAKRVNLDNSTGGAGVDSTNFTSLIHNYLSVSNLAKKVEAGVEFASDCLERGEKPCIGVASTVEAFIKDYALEHHIKPGEEIDVSFKDMLLHYASRSREISTRNAYGKSERRWLTDEEIGHEGCMVWDEIMDAIEELETSSLPISPIDFFKTKMTELGYSVGEVTGRSSGINYVKQEDGSYLGYYQTFKALNTAEIKRQTTDGFNQGEIDCLIGNRTMSTGISLHASENFLDQKQRHFLLLQPEGDINVAKQFFGRFDRTGQVNAPKITIGAADIPYERRMQSILMGKLAGLSANTTANRESQVDFGESRDFLNTYGDQVTEEVLKENPELNYRLNSPYEEDREYTEGELIRKLTGRLPILSIDEQELVMQQVEMGYDSLMQELDALGTNTLKSTTIDLDAVILSTVEAAPGKKSRDTPFSAPVTMDILDVASGQKPYTSGQVLNFIRQEIGLEKLDKVTSIYSTDLHDSETHSASYNHTDLHDSEIRSASYNHAIEQISQLEKLKESYQQERQDLFKTESSRQNFIDTTDKQTAVVTGMIRAFSVGTPVEIKTPEGNEMYGVVLNHHTQLPDKNSNPLRPSNHSLKIAVADGAKELNLAYSKFGSAKGKYFMTTQDLDSEEEEKNILQRFDEAQNADREQRYMMTGNLLKAADLFGNQGKIVHYTDKAGDRHPGFLMKKSFEPTRDLAHAPVRLTELEHIENFTKEQGLSLHTRDVRLSLSYDPEEQVYEISVPKSKKAGGEFFLDKKLLDAATPVGDERNEFYSRGDSSYLYFSPDELQTVVERLDSKWGLYAIGKEDTAVARELVGLEIPDFEDILATVSEVRREQRAVNQAETVEESTVNNIDSETLSTHSETQTVEADRTIDKTETVRESSINDIPSETLSTHLETETVEISNLPQAESEVETDISQNSKTPTIEITKLSDERTIDETETVGELTVNNIDSETLSTHLETETVEISNSPQAESEVEADVTHNHKLSFVENTNLEAEYFNKTEIKKLEEIQSSRVKIVAPITNELLKFVGEDCYEGSQNIAYRNLEDETLNIESLDHRHLMTARFDSNQQQWQNVNSSLSEQDVNHFQSIQAVLVQRIEETERNKKQQDFVEILAPLVADYHDLLSSDEQLISSLYRTEWDAQQQLLTLTDKDEREDILIAQLTEKGWKNIDSQLSRWQVDELEDYLISTLDSHTEELQTKRFEAIQPIIAEVLRHNKTNHLEGSEHGAAWDKSSQMLTAWKKGNSEPFLSAHWDGYFGWQDLGENVISFETAHHFQEKVLPKLEHHLAQSKNNEFKR